MKLYYMLKKNIFLENLQKYRHKSFFKNWFFLLKHCSIETQLIPIG